MKHFKSEKGAGDVRERERERERGGEIILCSIESERESASEGEMDAKFPFI